MSGQLLVLSDEAVRDVLSYPRCADAMSDALMARARGEFHQPLRSVFKAPDPGGLIVLMPAYQQNVSAGYGLKAINVVHGNPARGLDSHQGIVLLSDSETGEPIAVLNASAVTEIRTAAVSAVATNLLANADADVLTIIGAGVQASSHLRAIASTRTLTEIRVVARTAGKAQRFAAAMAPLAGEAKVTGYASAAEALAGAGIVVTATNSATPVIERQWLSPGAHINAVGACLPHTRELDATTVADAAFFGDSRESVLAEAGDYVLAVKDGAIGPDHLKAEIGDVLIGKARGRSGERELTIFESLGLAAEDLAAAAAAYQVAIERGIGAMVDFGVLPMTSTFGHSSVDYSVDFGVTPPPGTTEFATAGGIVVTRAVSAFEPDLLTEVTSQIDERRGGVFSSGMEYPGRYSRWHTGYVDPCVELTATGRELTATALNDRGAVILPAIATAMAGEVAGDSVTVTVPEPAGQVPEEQRSRRPTVFSAIREIIALFAGPDEHLGLYGAFGYDLAFQFEPIRLRPGRYEGRPPQRDLVLHLPDELYVIDRKRETALRYSYEFASGGRSTEGLPRRTPPTTPAQTRGASGQATVQPRECPPDPPPGEYAKVVEQARERFAAGDLFEVVPSHEFWATCGSPAAFYERLRRRNPAPYEFFLNLGDSLGETEYLVGASPEMYVRVSAIEGQYRRVETCPIAGTIARGASPLEDAEQIRTLLTSLKDESELTMCTDVDRNDKSRICVPGSVKVIGRRQIELYSRVIHTVDHVEGRLRPGFDALDAFLTHMWAVTVTGAPKTWAMQFIEDHETSPRRWYGGAVGSLGFNGGMNTGLTLRTARITGGLACVRTGATLLFDSEPSAEEDETRLKARALLEVLKEAGAEGAGNPGNPADERCAVASRVAGPAGLGPGALPGTGVRVLLVDHQDSFVHTLAGYFAEQGAEVTTLRAGFDPGLLDEYAPHLVVLSPGPGRPADFGCARLLDELDARRLPAFGVCLGLQAMVEHAGGRLSLLRWPAHGKPGAVRVLGGDLLAGLPAEFTAARYHSLHATAGAVGPSFKVTALTSDEFAGEAGGAGGEVVMAIEDPVAMRWGVQFHPESILTASGDAGRRVIANVLKLVTLG